MFIPVLFAVFYSAFYILPSLNVQNMCVKTVALLWHIVIKLLISTCLMHSIRWDDQPLKVARQVLYNSETSSLLCSHEEWKRLGIKYSFFPVFSEFAVFFQIWISHYVFSIDSSTMCLPYITSISLPYSSFAAFFSRM